MRLTGQWVANYGNMRGSTSGKGTASHHDIRTTRTTVSSCRNRTPKG
ncbi:MAG: hypothetical protein OJF51_002961 [Nitrospira sp.]|nr:MAG: hypothetical protein OJF51_002961 [Nitrospira sp.]